LTIQNLSISSDHRPIVAAFRTGLPDARNIRSVGSSDQSEFLSGLPDGQFGQSASSFNPAVGFSDTSAGTFGVSASPFGLSADSFGSSSGTFGVSAKSFGLSVSSFDVTESPDFAGFLSFFRKLARFVETVKTTGQSSRRFKARTCPRTPSLGAGKS